VDARSTPVRRLVTIPISHYCEKARWALERAGLDYAEERHVQGIHRIAARRAGAGPTVPVLVAKEGVFGESEQILEYADASLPEHLRLFPAEPSLNGEVRKLSRGLDEGLGPEGRRVMYAHMLEQRRLMMRVNCQGVPTWERAALAALWPAMVRLGKRALGIGSETVQRDEASVRKAFDAIAARLSDGRRYLCGDRFTAADLTFAALSAAVLVPTEYGVALPQPEQLPPYLAEKVQAFRDHPAGSYALGLFHEERRRPARAEPARA
jgi:glutathione S-transferase